MTSAGNLQQTQPLALQNKTRVAICICTFRRPELLRELLQGIRRLIFQKVQEPQLQIVVVDNDELASGEQVSSAASVSWPLTYIVEPRRGITYARNRAIVEARPVDFIAFIDDDEIPSPRWLDELLAAQTEFSADVVSGPVHPTYAETVAGWVKDGRFFDARSAATGTQRRTCACNNVLIAAHVFKRVPEFDDAFALSGAEDTDFFLRVWQAGYKIIWSQEAVVSEAVSSRRGTISWLLRREYQTGNGWVFCESRVDSSLRNWMLRFCKAGGHVILGSCNAGLRLLLVDRIGVVRSLQRISLGIGMLAGLVGHRFMAYQNPTAEVLALGRVVARTE